ncbi:hypothetical protein J7E50_02685 [Pedobacter sp. ISL-68]|uniref:hypothetical protein n=1 Tax=unclassified Pedobacter TaxID=2628915 RepID=UPI001BE6F073|nr:MULTISPECIES: hypothetical protein [unclassified Pedobacter]MBT2560126.1 hypothetical protein [Pedobacter sp. ISL-64]MBT2589105.1 hypothetical protein [Pedobacter sp. ISL-68]
MKNIFLMLAICLCVSQAFAQMTINDESIRYQQERMVFRQWDKNKFTPTSGFLGLNPYYWLTWGLMPGYKKTDLRPLGPSGPQSQRLALVATMSAIDDSYRLHADTLRGAALSEMAGQAGAVSAADPLWIMYYSRELRPVLNHSQAEFLNRLPAKVRQQVIAEGTYNWYAEELEMLKERIDAAKAVNMDRGARILAYHRMLMDYRNLSAVWATRTATAVMNMNLAEHQLKVRAGQVTIEKWTPQTDVQIADQVVQSRKY